VPERRSKLFGRLTEDRIANNTVVS